jgi:DNA polymerase-3 subunit epsilon/ATP-dependent DNA helicase DinG
LAADYVAIDLEATGLDAERDSIIEIGAVRFDHSGVRATFQTLVNPRRPVPPQVQRLTGITDAGVSRAPPLEAVAADLQAFIGGSAVVGHNILAFDAPLLLKAGVRHGPAVFDTLELSQLLLPGLAEYGLAGVAARFGIDFPVQHRASADAEATRRLFLALQAEAAGLPLDVLAQVAGWLTPTAYPWRSFFAQAWEAALGSGSAPRPFRRPVPPLPPPLHPEKAPRPVPPERPLQVLRSAASRKDVFPDFDERAEQQEMVRCVAQTIAGGGKLLAEAGTGTGKSLAYLIPAACQALANGQRVVISTATINLQEQLSRKDIPLLRELMREEKLRACQLKGRRNYLCLKQFDALREQPAMTDAEALIASRLLIWLCRTETGDRAELRLTQGEEALWRKLSADNTRCTADSSPYVVDGACFIHRARRQAEGSHLVVVNHALLLSDSVSAGRVLPPYEHLIIDEAHQLEDEATRQFGFSCAERELSELLDRCEAVPASVQAALQASGPALVPYDQIAETVRGLRQAATGTRPRLSAFAAACDAFLREHSPDGDEQRLPITRGMRAQPSWPALELAWENLRLALAEITGRLERLISLVTGPDGFAHVNQELLAAEIADLLGECQGLARGVSLAIEEESPDRVVWLERGRLDGGVAVSWVPLTVNQLLRDNLYADRLSVVLTGATLMSHGGFAYIQERLGLQDAETLPLGSPFDYRRAALVLLPRDIPEPAAPDYMDALADAVVNLCRASGGRALVLFTSHSSLQATYAAVAEQLRREGIHVLAQGPDGSPRQLVRALQAAHNSVLLGTASFWEGVDIPGEALSLLIMARLPFAVPTDPVFAARSALYDDPFGQYAVPQAVLRFKQGFGRLIRTKTDRGVLAVLDRRVLSKTYGRAFIEALPPCTVRQALVREMPAIVEAWLKGEATTQAAKHANMGAGQQAIIPTDAEGAMLGPGRLRMESAERGSGPPPWA